MSDNKQNQKIAATLASFYQSVIDAGGMPSWKMLNGSLFDFLCNIAAPNGIQFSYTERRVEVSSTQDKVSLVIGREKKGKILPTEGWKHYFVVCRPLMAGGYSLFPVPETNPTEWKSDAGMGKSFILQIDAENYLKTLNFPDTTEHYYPSVQSAFDVYGKEEEDSTGAT